MSPYIEHIKSRNFTLKFDFDRDMSPLTNLTSILVISQRKTFFFNYRESTNSINTVSYQSDVIQETLAPTCSQKTVPRMNEILDIRGQSPAQATDPPNSNILHTSFNSNQLNIKEKSSEDTLQESINKKKLEAKVSLKPLSKQDLDLMQKSLSKFVEKSPDLAKVYGITKEDEDPFGDSMFSLMKADERKTPSKRKLGMYTEEPQGELCKKKNLFNFNFFSHLILCFFFFF